ncbi:hypothetical protein DFH28DRAFT_939440 [Melampsora americana]|nr:hypothetical protein DFH28DRAFT_939440 [Melampsora americana]
MVTHVTAAESGVPQDLVLCVLRVSALSALPAPSSPRDHKLSDKIHMDVSLDQHMESNDINPSCPKWGIPMALSKSGLGAIATFVAKLIIVIAYFLVKSDLIGSCMNPDTCAKAQTLSGTIASIDSNEAQKLCEDDWQCGIWWDVEFEGFIMRLIFLHLVLWEIRSSFTCTASSNFSNQPQPSHQTNESNPMRPYLHQDSPFIPPKYARPLAHPPPEYVADKKFATRMPLVEGLQCLSLSDDGPQNRR